MNYVANFDSNSEANIQFFVVYQDINNPWILSPWEYPIVNLHHYKIIGHTLILCHVKKGLFFYDIKKQQLKAHVVYPEGWKISCIEHETYNQDDSQLLLSGRIQNEDATDHEDSILLIDIIKPIIRQQAFNINKSSWSIAVEEQGKHSWAIIDNRRFENYGYQDAITHWNPEKQTTNSQPFMRQSYKYHDPDTWISPSGKKVARTKYQGAEIIYKKGERHLRHYVEIFDSDNTFKTEALLIRDIHHHHIGYLHAPPEEMKGEKRLDDWEETWKLLHASKSAYRVYNFARYSPKIHKPIRWLWNKFHPLLAGKFCTPIENVIGEADGVHNDLNCVAWEEDEKAFWVLFRGGVVRRVSLSGKLSSLFVFSPPNRISSYSCMFPSSEHTRCLAIGSNGIISVKYYCVGEQRFDSEGFSFDPKNFDISDQDNVIVLTPDNCIQKGNRRSEKLQEKIDHCVQEHVDLTFELISTDTESIKSVLLQLTKSLQEGVDSHVYRGQLFICFSHKEKRYYEAAFFNEIATSPALADTIKNLLETYLKALSKAKHKRLYDGESAVLEHALMRWLILKDDPVNEFIPKELLEFIIQWLKVYRTYYGSDNILPYLLERYAIDKNWVILHFWESSSSYVALGKWNDKEKIIIEEKFTALELSNIFLSSYDTLWENVILPAIITDGYDDDLDESMTKEQLAEKIPILKKERFKSVVKYSGFSDEVKTILISNVGMDIK